MTDSKKTNVDDSLPSDDELDALQTEIDKVKADAMEAAKEAISKEAGELPVEEKDKAEIIRLQTELATLKDQALRAMADAENVKKRAEREVVAAKTYGIEKFAQDVLSVSDNLARALLTIDDAARDSLGENAKNLLEGLELTEKNLMLVLSRHGIVAVPGKGSKFDPNVHQAIANIPSDEDKGYVAEVMQTGFKLGSRTLRAAMVAVSTGPAKS